MGQMRLADAWDISLNFLYNDDYVHGLESFLRQKNARKILDCACGTGFPSIRLSENFDVTFSDGDSKMLGKAEENALKASMEISTRNLKWRELSREFSQEFDCVLCRGNSLVYVDSWGKNSLNPEKARKELEGSLRNFCSVLRPGGFCFIDTTSRREFGNSSGVTCENFGRKKIDGREYSLVWITKHHKDSRTRSWEPTLLEWRNGKVECEAKFHLKSYLLEHSELERMMLEAGFSKVDRYVHIPGEKNYDVFVGYKKQ